MTKYADSQDVPDLPCGGEGDDAQGGSDGWARGKAPHFLDWGATLPFYPPLLVFLEVKMGLGLPWEKEIINAQLIQIYIFS